MLPKQRASKSPKPKKRVDIKMDRELQDVPGSIIHIPKQVLKISLGNSEFCVDMDELKAKLASFMHRHKDVTVATAMDSVCAEISDQIGEIKTEMKRTGILESLRDSIMDFFIGFFQSNGISMLERLARVIETIFAALLNAGRYLLGM